MGRAPCCSKVGLHRGPWTPREDTLLTKYIQAHGEGHWRSMPKKAGLLRCGKSCRLRWMNYLRPDIKRGNITPDEDDLIIRLHALLGNRWSLIAGRLPGRTDNEIKNYWNTHLSKRLISEGTDPNTHKKLSDPLKELKRRKNNKSKNKSNNRSKQKNKSKSVATVGPEKPKVHLPKPVRITSFTLPRNDSFDWNVFSGSSGPEIKGGYVGSEMVNNVNPWCNFKDGENGVGVGFLIDDEDDRDDLVNGSDFECQSDLPSGDNSLAKLYEEYLDLLKMEETQVDLDDFAESLLI
ncbi:hypothetical protein SO802_016115 [Lithocarpus litseifolius]|uniref:Uncharacterized protein n=1 Tax=Lithocarpus litseifolius TaxID=425828 RepID=A0AAW2CY27_9ROSI